MLPAILEKSSTFVDRLQDLTPSNQTYSLTYLAGNLKFDIISSVVMDGDFGAQKQDRPSEFMRTYHGLFHTYTSEQIDLPWFFTPRTEWKRRQLANDIRTTLRAVIYETFANRNVETSRSRSIISLTLRDVDSLAAQTVDEAYDQLNTFFRKPRHNGHPAFLDILRAVADTKRVEGCTCRIGRLMRLR